MEGRGERIAELVEKVSKLERKAPARDWASSPAWAKTFTHSAKKAPWLWRVARKSRL